jgi:hypothetical protein
LALGTPLPVSSSRERLCAAPRSVGVARPMRCAALRDARADRERAVKAMEDRG